RTRRQYHVGAKRAPGRAGRFGRPPHRARGRHRLRAERPGRRRCPRRACFRFARLRCGRLAARHYRLPKTARNAEDPAGIEKKSRSIRTATTNQTPPNGGRRPVAYLNEQFLNSPDARAIRILAEFLEPLAHFRREKIRDTVVFFGSARVREDSELGQY